MPIIEPPSVFSGVSVAAAMQRQVIALPRSADIGQGVRSMIRYKVNAVLLMDQRAPVGVVTKTDLLGAYYAGLPIETKLEEVMGSQPIGCFPDDPLEDALEIMQAAGVHQLYVTGANRDTVIGTVSYSEIIGLLYRYCRACERGTAKKRGKRPADASVRLAVKDVMTREVRACRENDPLFAIIETLSTHHMGAVLIQSAQGSPAGVISKTDLIIAYHHRMAPETEARAIMSTPVYTVSAGELLATAIQQMLIRDVQRLFVHHDQFHQDRITGVLALSDSARLRSGSCRACTAGRMLIS